MDENRLLENRTLFDAFLGIMDFSVYPCMERQLYFYFVYQCLLTYVPVFTKIKGLYGRRAFLGECAYPPVKKAFRAVKIREISGLHNKLYAFCIRYRLYGLFRLFLAR